MTEKAATLKPPFEIYLNGIEIADADGHLCTAESPEHALAIVAALNAAGQEWRDISSKEPQITIARWWVDDVYRKLMSIGAFPTGREGDFLFQLRDHFGNFLASQPLPAPPVAEPSS